MYEATRKKCAYLVEMAVEELRREALVARQQVLERRERVRADLEVREVHVHVKELPQVGRVEQLGGEELMADRL